MRVLPAALALAVLAGVPVALAAGAERGADLTFRRVDGTHGGIAGALTPSEWGPFRLRLAARDGELTVLSHRVSLAPRPDGSHDARLAGRVQGRGLLTARLEAFGFATDQDDEVILPAQSREVVGRVYVEKGKDSYRVTTAELPREVTLEVRSRLGERLAGWCEATPLLAALGADCGGLRRALSTVAAPLPPAGETYEVPFSELTAHERAAVDGYLERTARGR